jgi:hypothetical protein
MYAGSAFFVKHAEQVMQLLGLLSLPYCYAAADGAMVLYLSRRLQDDAERRLSDTAEFIWNVMNPRAFTSAGSGFSSCLKIRVTHAAARYYTLKNSNWDANTGVPVNQEDMAGTNLAFSLIVIRGLRKLGYTVSYSEQQAFLHLWNVIGFLLGIDQDLIPVDGKSANQLEAKISKRQFRKSEQGSALAGSLLNYIHTATNGKVSEKQTIVLMRYLLGDKISALLDLPESSDSFYLPILYRLSASMTNPKSTNTVEFVYKNKYSAYQNRKSF